MDGREKEVEADNTAIYSGGSNLGAGIDVPIAITLQIDRPSTPYAKRAWVQCLPRDGRE